MRVRSFDREQTAVCLVETAEAAADLLRFSLAEDLFRQALQINPHPQFTLRQARMFLNAGRFERAMEAFSDAREAACLSGFAAVRCESFLGLSETCEAIGDLVSAGQFHQLALSSALEAMDKEELATFPPRLVLLNSHRHGVFDSDDSLRGIRTFISFLNEPDLQGRATLFGGRSALRSGNLHKARHLAKMAWTAFHRAGNHYGELLVWEFFAEIALRGRDWQRADHALKAASEQAKRLGLSEHSSTYRRHQFRIQQALLLLEGDPIGN